MIQNLVRISLEAGPSGEKQDGRYTGNGLIFLYQEMYTWATLTYWLPMHGIPPSSASDSTIHSPFRYCSSNLPDRSTPPEACYTLIASATYGNPCPISCTCPSPILTISLPFLPLLALARQATNAPSLTVSSEQLLFPRPMLSATVLALGRTVTVAVLPPIPIDVSEAELKVRPSDLRTTCATATTCASGQIDKR
ncbi:hypothetical protein BJX64DRAFT_148804 [Aspergillus heterothallicus]